jgi:hypothetical protein
MATQIPITTPLPQQLAAASTQELIAFYDYAAALVDHAGGFLNQPRCAGLPREWLDQLAGDLHGVAERIGRELLTRTDEDDQRAVALTHYLCNWFEKGDGTAVCSVLGIIANRSIAEAAA